MPRLSEEAAITALVGTETMPVTDNPGVVGGTKKITVNNFAGSAPFQSRYAATGGWVVSAAGSTFVPIISQGATTNIAKTVTKSQWHYDGDMIEWEGEFAMTAAGTAGSPVTVTLPVNALIAVNGCMGSAMVFDAAPAGTYVCIPATSAVGIMSFLPDAQAGNFWGVNPSLALASGDGIRFMVRYRWR